MATKEWMARADHTLSDRLLGQLTVTRASIFLLKLHNLSVIMTVLTAPYAWELEANRLA